MTLDEAVSILSDILNFVELRDPPEEHDAIKLGIEALEVYKKAQANGWYPPGFKLPGEATE